MDYQIRHINGKLLSRAGNEFEIEAGIKNQFQVFELDNGKEKALKNIIWAIHCGKENNKFIKSPADGILSITIEPNIAGTYKYELDAFLAENKRQSEKISSACFWGTSKPEVVNVEIKNPSGLKFGNNLDIAITANGLNGNRIRLGIYADDESVYTSEDRECIDGDIKFSIGGFRTIGWQKDLSEKQREFQLKLSLGSQPIPDAGGNEVIATIMLNGEGIPEIKRPEGKSMATVTQNEPLNYTGEEGFNAVIIRKKEEETIEITQERTKTDYIYLSNLTINVCDFAEFMAIDNQGKELEEPVGWKIAVENQQEMGLESMPEIIGTSNKLTGNRIKFAVPKEWGQKTISLTAYLKSDPEKMVQGRIYVKDHIAAAFFRINPDLAVEESIVIEKEAAGTANLPLIPLFHHQGVYKEDDTFYISGSTPPNYYTPAYVYTGGKNTTEDAIVTSTKGNSGSSAILFNKGILSEYTHPGGLQIAEGILAIGLERYWPGLPLTTGNDSLVCFFDTQSRQEYTDLRVILDKKYMKKVEDEEVYILENRKRASFFARKRMRDKGIETPDPAAKSQDENAYRLNVENLGEPKGNKASAVGIVYRAKLNDWIVAVRGNDKSIFFYRIYKNESSSLKISSLRSSFLNVGDFQNVNLFLDEKNDIYMFGMGNESHKEYYDAPIFLISDLSNGNNLRYTECVYPGHRLYSKMLELCSNGKNEVTINSRLLEDEDKTKDSFDLYDEDDEDDDWNNDVSYEDDFYRKSFNDIPELVVIKKIDSYYTTENICRIYRVVTTNDTPEIEAVWINDKGLLEYGEYNATDKNGVLFKCKSGSGPRFNWASCVYCDRKKQNPNSGFLGKLSLYATGQSVNDGNIIETISFHED